MRAAAALALGLALSVATVAPAYEPKVNYQVQCMGCHTADGAGQAGRVPSVRASLPQLVGSADGRRFLIQVPGVAQSPLSDAETAAVLNWMVQTLSEPPVGAGFVEFTTDA